MNEVVDRVATYVNAVLRFRGYAVLVATVVCLFGWTVVALLPDTYRATARIYVDTKTVLQPLLRGVAVERDVNQEIAAMQESLLSKPNLDEVVRRASLAPPDLSPKNREDVLYKLERSIAIGADAPHIFAITVNYGDARKAAEIAQALLDVFVDSSLGLGREDMEQARRFLEQQISEYERQLETAEQRAAAFKQENLAYLPSSGNFQASLDSAHQQVKNIAAELRDARTELDIIRAEMAVTPQTIEPGVAPPDDGSRLAAMQARLAELLTRLTEKHPDVIALRRKIEEGSLDEPANTGSGNAPTRISIAPYAVPNPGFASLKMRVVDKQAEVAKLQEKLSLAQEELKELESRAYRAPEVEAQMAKLNRDYSVLKSQYEELLSRRELARVSRDRDESAEVQFRIVDPPQVPAVPKGPPRRLLLTAVLPLACAAGIGMAIALSLLRVTYSSSTQLRGDFDLPVIGSVSFVPSPSFRIRRRMELVGLVVLSAGLLSTYGVLMTLEARTGLGRVVSAAIESQSLRPSFEMVSRSMGLSR